MTTLRQVRLYDRLGEPLPYHVGDRIQVRYTRRVDRRDDGYYYAVDPLYTDTVAKWWPIYDNRGVETVGYGTITRIWHHNDPFSSLPHCWVRME